MQNPFDELSAQPTWSDADKASFEKLDYLIHKVFAQTDEGQELLQIWKESLLMQSSTTHGEGLLAIGKAEGAKNMIRGIILTIRKVETTDDR